eukprot:6912823-Pyramimonas_sp.AAC.1
MLLRAPRTPPKEAPPMYVRPYDITEDQFGGACCARRGMGIVWDSGHAPARCFQQSDDEHWT